MGTCLAASAGQMTATPRTTKPSPDQARLKELMRRLAEATSSDAVILSIYVDIRPEAHGERPADRPELNVVRHRLQRDQRTLKAHTPARESLDADIDRFESYLGEQDLAGSDGLALFACGQIGLWEELRSNEPFQTQVAAGSTADLFQRRACSTTASARWWRWSTPTPAGCSSLAAVRCMELAGPDEPPDEHRRHDQGGWSQARFQRHIDMQDKRFAKEAAAAIEALMEQEKAQHLILAGDERVIPSPRRRAVCSCPRAGRARHPSADAIEHRPGPAGSTSHPRRDRGGGGARACRHGCRGVARRRPRRRRDRGHHVCP